MYYKRRGRSATRAGQTPNKRAAFAMPGEAASATAAAVVVGGIRQGM